MDRIPTAQKQFNDTSGYTSRNTKPTVPIIFSTVLTALSHNSFYDGFDVFFESNAIIPQPAQNVVISLTY